MDKIASFKPTENLKTPGAFAQPTKSGCVMVKNASAPFEKSEITRRALGPSDVAIQIKFVGICHSDIHQARDHWSPGTFPMVPGHEIVGVVVTTGLVESSFQPGDAVGVGCMVREFLDGITVPIRYRFTAVDGLYTPHLILDRTPIISKGGLLPKVSALSLRRRAVLRKQRNSVHIQQQFQAFTLR